MPAMHRWPALCLGILMLAGCGSDGGNATPPAPPPRPGTGAKPTGPVVIMPAEETRVLVEAEAAAPLVAPFQVMDDSLASGGKCLTLPSKGCNGEHHQHIAPEGTPERTAGSAELAFKVEKEGDYVLWIRKWWCCSCGDSFSLSLDGAKPFVFGNDGTTPRHWSWLEHKDADGPVKFRLGAGEHKLVFGNRGESGFRIDQLLFTADLKAVPQGKETD